MIFILLFILPAQGSEVGSDCSVTIPDFDNNPHIIDENYTTLDVDTREGGLVCVEGECCFQLFTEESGQGGSQLLDSSGEFRLNISPVRSLYMVECVSPFLHPVLKFLIIAVAVIISLYCIVTKGKEYLFRKRF